MKADDGDSLSRSETAQRRIDQPNVGMAAVHISEGDFSDIQGRRLEVSSMGALFHHNE